MRNNLLFIIISIMAFDCAYNEPELIEHQLDTCTDNARSLNEQAIINKISLTRKDIETKAAGHIKLEPYTWKGDTVMYVVNYEDGWEIYSNCRLTPMLLMYEKAGNFEISKLKKNPAFEDFFNTTAEYLYQAINMEDYDSQEQHHDWLLYTNMNDDEWRLVGTYPYDHIEDEYGPLLATHWSQDTPYNLFVPFLTDSITHHAPAGCVPVACAQFLYYSHYKWGVPTHSYTASQYNQSTNRYTFSGLSTATWNDMEDWTFGYFGNLYESKLIGSAGVAMGTHYAQQTNQGSATSTSAIPSYINAQTGFSSYITNYNLNYIINNLRNERPTIVVLSTLSESHTVISDYCYIIGGRLREYYVSSSGYEANPGDNDMEDWGEYDNEDPYNYLVARYGEVRVVETTEMYRFIKFNWGWGPFVYSPLISTEIFTMNNSSWQGTQMLCY